MRLIEFNWRPSVRELRVFGIGLLVVLLGIAAWIWLRGGVLGIAFSTGAAHGTAWVLVILAAASGGLAMVFPKLLKPIFVGLSLIAYPIGFVIGHVMVGVIYFGVITPIGLIMRLLGRDPMQRRFEPKASTYWEDHASTDEVDRYFRQW